MRTVILTTMPTLAIGMTVGAPHQANASMTRRVTTTPSWTKRHEVSNYRLLVRTIVPQQQTGN